jgi:hypothetical protein
MIIRDELSPVGPRGLCGSHVTAPNFASHPGAASATRVCSGGDAIEGYIAGHRRSTTTVKPKNERKK